MSVPSSLRLRNVKVPVSELGVAVEWYRDALGFQPSIEFRDSDGVVRGVHGDLPGSSAALALREDPEAARGLGAFAISNFEVPDRGALEAWATHLDAIGVQHDPIVDGPRLSVLILRNPDGQEVHLYTPIRE
jgi:catechol-2,3-dioxygenase